MRVLHILNELKASGAEVMLVRAASLWDGEGIESHVLATGEVVGDYALNLESCGFEVHHLPFSPKARYLYALRGFVARGRYDVVHVHSERGFFWTALAARAGGVREIVRSVHNVFPFSGALRLERQVQRALLRLLGVVFISVSESVEKNERRRFRNPTVQMRNWIDTEVFVPPARAERLRARRHFGLDDADLVLVTVGNCGQAKNHEAVIEALSALSDLRVVYLHAGQEDRNRSEQRLAASMGVLHHCRFLGRVEDVRELLHASDVYVMPSYYEGLGIAALEAAATGLPCVLARVPGLGDLEALLGDGAVWIKPDATSVVEGVRAVAAGRSGAGVSLRTAVTSEFGVERGASDLVQLYRSLRK